jgi:DMSO reductase anchor subunit
MMYCSGEALVTLMLLGVGLLAATMHLQSKGQQVSESFVG